MMTDPCLPTGHALDTDFFERPVEIVARDLIGTLFLIDGVGGTIVETEAYDPQDPAAHTFRGPTKRNAAMFGPAGHAYVYLSHGIHWCVNFTCGNGAGVLIRALEPKFGIDAMRARRGLADMRLLCAGPGRLCQALAIDKSFGGLPLDRPPFALRSRSGDPIITAGPRIGISVAKDTPWRFCASDSRFLSRPLGASKAA
jgi:DNA-3-methyladenine glycosylase